MVSYILIIIASVLESLFVFYAVPIIARKEINYSLIDKMMLALIIFLKTVIIHNTQSFHLLGMVIIMFTIFVLIKNSSNSVGASIKIFLLLYIIMITGEIIISLLATGLSVRFDSLNILHKSLFSFASIFCYIIILHFTKTIVYYFKNLNNYQLIRNYIMVSSLIIFNLIINIYLNARVQEYSTLFLMIIITQIVLLIFFLFLNHHFGNYKSRNQILNADNHLLIGLLKREKKINHEYLNDLVILNDFLPSNKVVSNIISKYIVDSKAQGIFETNHNVPIAFKSILESKIELIKNRNIEYHFTNSILDLILSDEDSLKISKLIAIFLDNAIDASVDKNKSFILINIYENNSYYRFEITNWFCNNWENSKIKGNGLEIAKTILTNAKGTSVATTINDNYYTKAITVKKTT